MEKESGKLGICKPLLRSGRGKLEKCRANEGQRTKNSPEGGALTETHHPFSQNVVFSDVGNGSRVGEK